jgi:hypothetical protein
MEETCGARLTMNYFVPGGVMYDLHPNFVKRVKEFIVLFKNKIGEYDELVTGNVIFQNRMKNIGVISKEDAILGHRFFSFPTATYFVNKQELESALAIGSPSYTPKEFEILSGADNVVLTEGDGAIDGYIRYEVCGAHSPYHQVFHIEENEQHVFFGGDVAPQLQQMKSKFIAKYDFDGKKCMELRQEWWQIGQAVGWTFLFYHDIKTPVMEFKTIVEQ